MAVDPVTGTLQVSPGVASLMQAQIEERERQERTLPGETGGIGTQVQVDPVTGTLQVSSGVANALAAEAEQRAIMGEGTLAVIRGDLNEPITIEDATHAIGRIFTSREEEAGEGTTEDGVALDAQSVRYQRSSSGGIYTPDEIRAAFPDLPDDQVKQQVALQAVLDIYNETQNPNIGSIQLTSELRRRGMDPNRRGPLCEVDGGQWTRHLQRPLGSRWCRGRWRGRLVRRSLDPNVHSPCQSTVDHWRVERFCRRNW